ncbi:MAG: type III-B CRISPR-associated protein Cas10/Cmr2 [Bacteroidota bacterium]
MKTYYAMTIGPIYKTLSMARKTRELWSGSYLFSYLMKQLLMQLTNSQDDIILPYAGVIATGDKKVNLLHDPLEAGLFPDRCVIKMQNGQSLEDLKPLIESVIEELIAKMIRHLDNTGKVTVFKSEAQDYFNNYLQVYAVSESFDEEVLFRDIVKKLFDALDVLELQSKVIPKETQSYIYQFMTISSFRAGGRLSFLKKDAGLSAERFESVIEIAAKELIKEERKEEFYKTMKINDDNTEESLIDNLKEENKDDYRTHHKYIAIVHVDGDNFGAFIKSLDNDTYTAFTKSLARFSLKANKLIQEYGGQPVYLGGDDALFFAPVRNGNQNIFSLLDEIDHVFKEEFEAFKTEGRSIPTLSAGVAIHYYKHPLTETLERSRELLFGEAKDFKTQEGERKNAIAIEVQKHSGLKFNAVFSKSKAQDSPYHQFKAMLTAHIDDGIFLNSVIQQMQRHQVLLNVAGADLLKIGNFINNQFNEPVHDVPPFSVFLKGLKDFIPRVYQAYPAPIKDAEQDQRAVALYGGLRLVKFLNRDDNE